MPGPRAALGAPDHSDATYLALAELVDYEFWTADRRFAAGLPKRLPRLRVVPSGRRRAFG